MGQVSTSTVSVYFALASLAQRDTDARTLVLLAPWNAPFGERVDFDLRRVRFYEEVVQALDLVLRLCADIHDREHYKVLMPC